MNNKKGISIIKESVCLRHYHLKLNGENKMKYAELGKTGIYVSRICLGTMTFGGADNAAGNAIGRLTGKEADIIVGEALDAGINFIDTADIYGMGGSESVLGEVLAQRRSQVFLATKAHSRMNAGANDAGQSRYHLMQALEASLKRLKTDHIDLYQVHNFDTVTPIEEVLRTLDDMVRQGKVRYIGCSNYAGWQIAKALGISGEHKLEKFASVQSFYSLACRDIEHELLPAIKDSQTGLLCWSPLAGGLLSGKFDRSGSHEASARRAKIEFPPVDKSLAWDIVDVLKTISEKHRTTPASIAIAWLLSSKQVTSVIAGVRNVHQLRDNLSALSVNLSEEEKEMLDKVSHPGTRYPGWIQSYNAASRYPAGFPDTGPNWILGESPV
ncbi:aryl-alcohol dehydrogenase-like predicted oxidoreductase [Pantoea agglomerans]|jgi:aryl-alcohol dehydrogenase-like predicted oxidoreductase|nr:MULTISPECIES: aldo/keto reductase [Pantoea]MBA8869748.1 aryl-alcohol dehydrogenase-like predicted oxidoreductase [Pantoea agglomerans]MBA8874126.1 aryl-alcohol dehydrogenase-like predicted oxidoreductase [Pantoea agglomerans]WGK60040.1 aldo/keto reductase [Pantoea sp. SS70]